jgi:hypothetical protein
MVYKTNLELVNIDIVSANTVSSFFASIGDAQSIVYVGFGAGIAHSNMVSSSNSNTTFLGPGAGNTTSNVRDSIFSGYNSGQNSRGSSNNLAIGSFTLFRNPGCVLTAYAFIFPYYRFDIFEVSIFNSLNYCYRFFIT